MWNCIKILAMDGFVTTTEHHGPGAKDLGPTSMFTVLCCMCEANVVFAQRKFFFFKVQKIQNENIKTKRPLVHFHMKTLLLHTCDISPHSLEQEQ